MSYVQTVKAQGGDRVLRGQEEQEVVKDEADNQEGYNFRWKAANLIILVNSKNVREWKMTLGLQEGWLIGLHCEASWMAFWLIFASWDSSPANLLWPVENILEFLLGVCSSSSCPFHTATHYWWTGIKKALGGTLLYYFKPLRFSYMKGVELCWVIQL